MESLSPHQPCRFEPTTVRTHYPQGKFKLAFPIYAPCRSICGYTHTRLSDILCHPTTPSASPLPLHISLFLFFFSFSFCLLLPHSTFRRLFRCCFLLFYSLILFQTVTVLFFFFFFFFCTCDIQFHTSPHHPSIHTHIHVLYLPTSSIYVH